MRKVLITNFFSGLFLFNSIPHLVKGITGKTHMTPLKRVSSPYLNIVWAFVNIVLSVIIFRLGPTQSSLAGHGMWAFLAGGLFISLADAQLFSKKNARLPWQKN